MRRLPKVVKGSERADCEDRFNKRGEAWVLKNCGRDEKTFRLQNGAAESKQRRARRAWSTGLERLNV